LQIGRRQSFSSDEPNAGSEEFQETSAGECHELFALSSSELISPIAK
jgi:hypothetical protein